MGINFHIARGAAHLCRADRHQRQHADAGQGDPPRNPPGRRRCVQQLPGQALAGPDQLARLSSRTSSRSSRSQGSAPDRVVLEANVEEKSTGELSAVGGLFEPREVHHPGVDHAAQFPRQGPGAARQRQLFELFEVGRARLHRALSVRQEHRARRRYLPPRLQRVQLCRRSAARRPTARSRPASRSAPACR